MTFLFDWISLLFMGFVFIISSLVILYSDDYMFGDLNIIRFISLVLIFVVSIIFLIISPNIPPPKKKIRHEICRAIGNSGIISVLYQLPILFTLCSVLVYVGRVPRNMKYYFSSCSTEGRLGKTLLI